MRKLKIAAVSVLLSILMLSYGCTQATTANHANNESSSDESSTITDTSTESSENTVRKQKLTRKINVDEKPEITKAELIALSPGKIIDYCTIDPYYPGNVSVSNTVGLIGPPIKISCDDVISEPTLTLTYSEENLRGVPERNIAVMYVETDPERFVHLDEAKLDTEKNEVSFSVKNEGIYLLFDIYAYGSVMYWDVSDYVYKKDLTEYISDWERECDTGDIMSLTDKNWAKENAPDFHVTNEKELASVVYYTNVIGGEINIYLENDIVLSDYKWAPMSWRKLRNNIINIYGQNHTITGLNINMPLESEVGLTGDIRSIKISDLTIQDAYIKGRNYAGIICGECNGDKVFERVSISGEVFGTEGNAGAFVGTGAKGQYIDCTFDVKVNGEPFDYYTSEDKLKAEHSDTDRYTLSVNENGRVQRTEAEFDKSLSWVIYDGTKHILTRGAENELEIPDWVWKNVGTKGTTYTIYLEGYTSTNNEQGYIILSNTIEYQYQ